MKKNFKLTCKKDILRGIDICFNVTKVWMISWYKWRVKNNGLIDINNMWCLVSKSFQSICWNRTTKSYIRSFKMKWNIYDKNTKPKAFCQEISGKASLENWISESITEGCKCFLGTWENEVLPWKRTSWKAIKLSWFGDHQWVKLN